MTKALKSAFQQAEKLSQAEQDHIASVVKGFIEDTREADTAFTRLAESAFVADWDNDKDATYDNWQERYGVSNG
jgi:hypothetical protein